MLSTTPSATLSIRGPSGQVNPSKLPLSLQGNDLSGKAWAVMVASTHIHRCFLPKYTKMRAKELKRQKQQSQVNLPLKQKYSRP